MSEKIKISLPGKKDSEPQYLEIDRGIVIIGANGSGKTRFSAQIERGFLREVHRITAQKSLEFPEKIVGEVLHHAEHLYRWGVYSGGFGRDAYPESKEKHRYSGNIITKPLKDFNSMMDLLFPDHHEKGAAQTEGSKLIVLKSIWESTVSDKKLKINRDSIEVISKSQPNQSYNASELSDGERAIFYFIGSVLCAHQNALLVIDEPEIHLHKSITVPLWDAIEAVRPDCKFIYLTHDIDFALSRKKSEKVWLKEFIDGNLFDYEILEHDESLPPELYLRVLGSRKPIIFIEGGYGSIDFKIYSTLFPNYTLLPSNSCNQVITYTKAFRQKIDFHRIQSFGIIDRDRRTDRDIHSLQKSVMILKVAECEHIILSEIIIKLVVGMNNLSNNVLDQIKNIVFDEFQSSIKVQCFEHTKYHFKKKFEKAIDSKSVMDYRTEIENFKNSINIDEKLNEFSDKFQKYIDEKDYNSVLTVFNNKNLLENDKILSLLGFASADNLIDSVCGILSDQSRTEVVHNLRKYLGIDIGESS
jgi:energy-coupling factor transporter ATP-binding protein EcfA2